MNIRREEPIAPLDPKNKVDVGSDIENQGGSATRNESPQSSTEEIDPELEERVVRKIDLHLIPLVMVLYLLAYLDRSNIGNARAAGLDTSLNLSSSQYSWLLTIFYISYILFEPLSLMWKILPPHIWGTICVLGFAICGTLQAATFNWSSFMAVRFFLGGFEAAFAPGITYLLSFFYLRNELGLRCGLYTGAAPLATCFAGALAYGITSGGTNGIEAWRVLFLAEGLPSVLAAVVVWFFMPDSAETARFLNDEERNVAKARSVRQVGDEGVKIGVDWKDVWVTCCDIKPWITALMYFSCNVSFSSLPVFLPTILQAMGFTAINAQGLSAPPYFLAFLVLLITCWLADRTAQRGYTILFLSLIGAAGYIMLAISKTTGVRYAGVFLAASGVFPAIGNIVPWVLNNQASETGRGTGIAIINFVGQCGPLLGTRLYPSNEGPYYKKGMWICAAFMLVNATLALGLRAHLVSENRKFDREYGTLESLKDRKEFGQENAGPRFRYIL